MKKALKVLYITAIIVAIIGCAAVITMRFMQSPMSAGEGTPAMEFYEANVEPVVTNVTVALTAVAPLLWGLLKLINWLEQSVKKISDATNKVTSTSEDNKVLHDEIKAMSQKFEFFGDEIKSLKSEITRVKQAQKIGFTNMKDLVASGYSRKIAEVLDETQDQNSAASGR